MKDRIYCPLCGSDLPPQDGDTKCEVCGAKEYRIPGIKVPIGYLYAAEYYQLWKLGIIIMILIFMALLVWYIFKWKTNQILPPEISGLWKPWLEKFYATL